MTEMNAKEMAKLAIHALEEKKAEDIGTALASGNRVMMPDIAPPQALYLAAVEYPDFPEQE